MLHLFAVSPEFRGQGIASSMLSAIKSSARKAIHLDVIEGNDSAGKLYRKNGFALVKQTELFTMTSVKRAQNFMNGFHRKSSRNEQALSA